MRVRRGELSGVAADSLAKFYTDGRAERTLSTYSAAYKKVVQHGERIGSSVFRWKE